MTRVRSSFVADPAPSALETMPSIPETPRLPRAVTLFVDGETNRSRSRTGIELETNSVAGSGRASATARSASPSWNAGLLETSSVGSASRLWSRRAIRSALSHCSRQPGSPPPETSLESRAQSRLGSATTRSVAANSASRQRPAGSTWYWSASVPARYFRSRLEVGEAPSLRTASGWSQSLLSRSTLSPVAGVPASSSDR